ncbi:MAG: hypothetical protein DWH91_19220 [Planctomycetota bacterium]|nr:MAG: hypothetical protein DWH91_19220 [Planctomycetota bacterium]
MNPDFCDMLCAFNDAGVEYLVVGAYALATHGLVRATGDIDLWVRPTASNAERVISALRKFGAPLGDLTEEDLCAPDIVFQIGLPPRRIDLLTSIASVEFDEAWKTRRQTTVSEIPFSVLGRAMLLKNKRSTGRTKDAADAEWLENNPE